jgi:nicotinate-nucleotide--dimethylbenzimidazole phosphoribosyltransferase
VARARAIIENDLTGAIADVCGYEIAAMAGFYARGGARGCTLLLDGYVATAAALIAERLAPGTVRSMIAGHRSAEPGHAAALAALGLAPILEWEMRLGEASGALVALPLLDAAAALLTDVARLDAIGADRAD